MAIIRCRVSNYLLASFWVMSSVTMAASQQRSGIDGLWALSDSNRDWCGEYLSGKLNDLPMSIVTNSGLVQVNQNSLEWVYSAASCDVQKLDGGPNRYLARARCEFKSKTYNNDITFTVRGPDQMSMGFSDSDFPFSATATYKRCNGP
jgi:hypothetical protein